MKNLNKHNHVKVVKILKEKGLLNQAYSVYRDYKEYKFIIIEDKNNEKKYFIENKNLYKALEYDWYS